MSDVMPALAMISSPGDEQLPEPAQQTTVPAPVRFKFSDFTRMRSNLITHATYFGLFNPGLTQETLDELVDALEKSQLSPSNEEDMLERTKYFQSLADLADDSAAAMALLENGTWTVARLSSHVMRFLLEREMLTGMDFRRARFLVCTIMLDILSREEFKPQRDEVTAMIYPQFANAS